MERLGWSEEKVLRAIQTFILHDCEAILTACKEDSGDPTFLKIAATAMADLLCIRYHKEAAERCNNYTLTYNELCTRIGTADAE